MLWFGLLVCLMALLDLVDCAYLRCPLRHYIPAALVLVGYGVPLLLAVCCSSGR